MPLTVVTRTWLELRDPSGLRPGREPAEALAFRPERPCSAATYRSLYASVGGQWYWRDRLAWSDEELVAWLANSDVEVWILWTGDDPAGYVELLRHEDSSVELAYFGLRSGWHGRGLGGWMLSMATRRAWELGAQRVWLHTCTLDGPAALPNYLARGFQPYRTEVFEQDVAAAEPAP